LILNLSLQSNQLIIQIGILLFRLQQALLKFRDGTRNLPHIVAELSHPSDAQQNDDRNKFSHTNPYNA